MLIINADDFGRSARTTSNILACFQKGTITTTSAMVFMADSESSGELAQSVGLETGLHLNFTLKFDGHRVNSKLRDSHNRIASFLLGGKYRLVLYNPLLVTDFDYVYKAQYEEYFRLYDREPAHVNGHHHMHVCTNMIIGGLIPRGHRVRRSFSFNREEKGAANRFYRSLIDAWIAHRYTCTDYFYSIKPLEQISRLEHIIKKSYSSNVELSVHPDDPDEHKFLTGSTFSRITRNATMCDYSNLSITTSAVLEKSSADKSGCK